MRFIAYLIILCCFLLSGWQGYRFYSKSQEYKFFERQNRLINSNQKIFIDQNMSALYSWQGKSYSLNLKNNEIYKKAESIWSAITKNPQNNEKLSDANLFFRNEICGEYLNNHGFAVYNPKTTNNSTKNGYSAIVPLIFENKILLVKYKWSELQEEITDEISQIENFIQDKSTFPKNLLGEKKLGLCFNGILLPVKKYYSNKILALFSMNDLKKNIWTNLNEPDLKKHFKDYKISEYILDANANDLSPFMRQYLHHFFYMIMWALSGGYLIYIIAKNKKSNIEKKV